MPFLQWVLALAGVAVVWTIVVCLLLNVEITSPVPAWWERMVEGALSLFAEDVPVCPHCAKPGKRLGGTAHQDWFYCPACNGNPWPRPKSAPSSQAVA